MNPYSATGGSTVTGPVGGFTSKSLETIFSYRNQGSSTNVTSSTHPTSPATTSSKSKTSTGAIVGGVIGGLAALALIAALLIYYFRKRRRNYAEEKQDAIPVTTEMPGQPNRPSELFSKPIQAQSELESKPVKPAYGPGVHELQGHNHPPVELPAA